MRKISNKQIFNYGILACLILISGTSIYYNYVLEKELEEMDVFFDKIFDKESGNKIIYREYDSINEVELYNITKYDQLSDKNNKELIDSIKLYKSVIKLMETRYNVHYNTKFENDFIILNLQADKVDSALALFPYFKDRIIEKETNEKGGVIWTISVDKK